MTGLFYFRPLKPKLRSVWDVDIFFRYFEQGGNNPLSDKLLAQKLLILLLLIGTHRISTAKLFSVSNMVLNKLSVTFYLQKYYSTLEKANLWTNWNINQIRMRNYALYHALGNIWSDEISM